MNIAEIGDVIEGLDNDYVSHVDESIAQDVASIMEDIDGL